MAVLRALLAIYSFLYHFVFTLFLIGISSVALLSRTDLRLGMLPWNGRSLTYWVFFSSLAGLIALLLAIAGKLRFLFLLWSLVVVVMMVRGFYLSAYSFENRAAFNTATYLTLGAVIAAFGAMVQTRRGAREARR